MPVGQQRECQFDGQLGGVGTLGVLAEGETVDDDLVFRLEFLAGQTPMKVEVEFAFLDGIAAVLAHVGRAGSEIDVFEQQRDVAGQIAAEWIDLSGNGEGGERVHLAVQINLRRVFVGGRQPPDGAAEFRNAGRDVRLDGLITEF